MLRGAITVQFLSNVFAVKCCEYAGISAFKCSNSFEIGNPEFSALAIIQVETLFHGCDLSG